MKIVQQPLYYAKELFHQIYMDSAALTVKYILKCLCG